jgi:hypothetical protein
MENKHFIIILIILVVIVSAFLGIRIKFLKSPIGVCETLIENNAKINVVFLSEGIGKEKLIEYANFLAEAEPYKNTKINFYYAGEAECEIVQGNILLCYSSDIVRKAASCKNDVVAIISSRSGLRSSAYGNIISISSGLPKSVFLHEFGHAFANLADEYVPSEIPSGSKNCQKACNFLIEDGCFEGCSKSSYYRSTDNSVMRTLSTNDYGKLNIHLIENAIQKY